MHIETIKKLQRKYGLTEMQNLINSGEIWKFEGSAGREAMRLLESGACMLPIEKQYDYYGNLVPGRTQLKKGSTGTFHNSENFWKDSQPEIW